MKGARAEPPPMTMIIPKINNTKMIGVSHQAFLANKNFHKSLINSIILISSCKISFLVVWHLHDHPVLRFANLRMLILYFPFHNRRIL